MDSDYDGFGQSSIFPVNKSRNRLNTATAYGYGYLNNPPPELEQEREREELKKKVRNDQVIPYNQRNRDEVSSSTSNINVNAIFEIAAELVAKRLEEKFNPQPKFTSQQQLLINALNNTKNTLANYRSDSGASQPKTELVTGVVSQIQETFGMIGTEVFFMLSNVVGPIPKCGDKVVVEAESVSGMPFKMNAKRVQVIAKDLSDSRNSEAAPMSISATRNISGASSSRRRNSDIELNFGPLPQMPSSLNLLDKWKTPTEKEREASHIRRPQPVQPPPPPKLYDIHQSSLSFDLSSDCPVVHYQEKTTTPPKKEKTLKKHGNSIKHSSSSKSRKSRSESRSRSRSRNRSFKKSSRKSYENERKRHSRSPRRNEKSHSKRKVSDEIEIITEYSSKPQKASKRSATDSSSSRKEKREPRSLAAMIRHHVVPPAPESERFVPNPLAQKTSGSTVLSKVPPKAPAVRYLHNPDFIPPADERDQQYRKMENSLIDKKMSQIEERERLLQMQERVLRAEMQLQEMERDRRNRGNEGSVLRLEVNNCKMPKWELASKSRRSRSKSRSSTPSTQSRHINGVEWVTKEEERRRNRRSSGEGTRSSRTTSHSSRDRSKRPNQRDLLDEIREQDELERKIHQQIAIASKRDYFGHDRR